MKKFFILVFAVSVIFYINSLWNGFVYDDNTIVENNTLLQSAGNIPKLFVSNYWANTPYEKSVLLYRPIVTVSFALDFIVWGKNPFGFHLMNIVLNALAAGILLLILKAVADHFNIKVSSGLCVLPALAFAAHAVHTEAVDMIVGRTEILAAIFYFTSIFLFLKKKTWLSGISFFLALLCKENAVTLPVILFFLSLFAGESREWKKYIPFGLFLILYLAIRTAVLGGISSAGQAGILYGNTLFERACIVFYTIGIYIKLLLFPYPLTPDYSDLPLFKTISVPWVFVPFLLVVLLVLLVIKFRKKNTLLAFSAIWFIITILPVANIISVGALAGERFMYIPAAALSFAFLSFISKEKSVKKITALVLAGIFVGVSSTFSFERNFDWKDNSALWAALAKKRPENVRANYNVAVTLESKGQTDQALEYYKKVAKVYPDHNWQPDRRSMDGVNQKIAGYYYQRSLEEYKKKKYDDSQESAANAINYYPAYAEAYIMLGNNYYQQNDVISAINAYKKAMEIDPAQQEARKNYEMMIKAFPSVK